MTLKLGRDLRTLEQGHGKRRERSGPTWVAMSLEDVTECNLLHITRKIMSFSSYCIIIGVGGGGGEKFERY